MAIVPVKMWGNLDFSKLTNKHTNIPLSGNFARNIAYMEDRDMNVRKHFVLDANLIKLLGFSDFRAKKYSLRETSAQLFRAALRRKPTFYENTVLFDNSRLSKKF